MNRPMRVMVLSLALSGLFAGCTSNTSRTQPPAPVVHRGELVTPDYRAQQVQPGAVQQSSGQQPAIAAYIPPAQPQTARPEPAKAIEVLMRRAEDQRQAGDLVGAVSSIERGLRIEPRNPELWHRLALVREAQEQFPLAEELAGKSNSMAGVGELQLKRDNWQLIARSRRAQGKSSEAREAERQAGRY